MLKLYWHKEQPLPPGLENQFCRCCSLSAESFSLVSETPNTSGCSLKEYSISSSRLIFFDKLLIFTREKWKRFCSCFTQNLIQTGNIKDWGLIDIWSGSASSDLSELGSKLYKSKSFKLSICKWQDPFRIWNSLSSKSRKGEACRLFSG